MRYKPYWKSGRNTICFYDGKMANTYVCRRPCTAVNAISAQPLAVTGIFNLSGKRWGTDNFCFVLVEMFFIQDNCKGSQCENSRITITQRYAQILRRLICISTSGTLSVRPSRYCLKPTDMYFDPLGKTFIGVGCV